MRKLLFITVIIFPAIWAYAQDEQQINNYIENIIEQTASTSEDADLESIISDLEFLYQNPLNINSATADELEKLTILNDFQITSIIEYRRKMRQIVSIHELRYVYGFNDRTVDLITPFIVCGPVEYAKKRSLKDLVKRSNHEIFLRTSYRDNANKNYIGSPIQQYTKYSGSFSNFLKIGLVAEKDAGEQFAKGVNKYGYDFYSGYAHITTKTFLKSLTLGDYRVRLGQGLLIWNGYSSGKSSEITSIQKRGQGISANTSKDEYNFLRGAAATIGKDKLWLTIWGSSKQIDGTIDIDTLINEDFLRSINISGYHRSATEIARKNNIEEIAYGASIIFKSLKYSAGFNWLHSEYSMPVEPDSKTYKYYSFTGNSYDGYSTDFKILFQKTQFYGEVAYANNGLAGIVGVNLMPNSRFTGNLFYRHYQPEYYSPYANPMVESGDPNNEKGLFAGIKWYTDWKTTLSAYSDVFSIPWFSFNSNGPSKGVDYLVEMDYMPTRSFELILRYKFKEKEKNFKSENQKTTEILPLQKQSLRIYAKYKISEKLRMASRIEVSESDFSGKSRANGYLLYQDISYHMPIGSSLYFRYAQFNIDDSDSKIYAYENDVLYAYSIPAYNGNGQKFYIMLRQKLGKNITLWLRYANTNPFDDTTNKKNEYKAQVKINF